MSDTQVIDFSAQAGAGLENVSNEDLQVPFLQIIQTNSPEVDKAASDYESKGIEGASAGDVFDTVSRKVIADFGEPVRVIPIAYNKAYVEWVPREQGGGIVTVHKDPGILTQTTKKTRKIRTSWSQVTSLRQRHIIMLCTSPTMNGSMRSSQCRQPS